MKVALVSANEGRKQNHEQTERDFRQIKRFAPFRAKIIGFQEIDEDDPADERVLLDKVFPRYNHTARFTRVPILSSPRFGMLDREVRYAHGGLAGVTPHRVITRTVLDPGAGIPPFAVLNGHAVAGAWNANKDQRAEAMRRILWIKYFDLMAQMMEDDLAAGRSVFRLGDDNRLRMEPLVKGERSFGNDSIDSITFTKADGGAKFKKTKVGTFDTHSDHAVMWVKGEIY